MKLKKKSFALLFTCFWVFFSGTISAQDKKITIQKKNITLEKALVEIEKQTGYSIAYGQSKIDLKKQIVVSVKDASLEQALGKILKNTGISYKINGYHIILIPSKEKQGEDKENKTRSTSVIKDTISKESTGILLDEVVVSARDKSQQLVESTQMGALNISREEIKNVPALFGEADVIKVLQTQPGVSAGVEGLAGMYVRGGNGDENLYMLDGNPLYQVNHLGGLYSAFNSEIIKDVDFFKSAFPARYGGRLSSVMNVHTKDGNRKEYHGAAMIGLTSGSLSIEGPLFNDKTSFNASIRRSWLDAISIPALAFINKKNEETGRAIIGRYAFTDLNLKVSHYFNPRSKGYINLYYGNDFLKIGEKEFSAKNESYFYEKKEITQLQWGNLLFAAGWSYQINEKLLGNINASYTRYASTLGHSSSNIIGEEGDDYYEKTLNEQASENGIEDRFINVNFNYYPHSSHRLNFGGNYAYHRFRPENFTQNATDTLYYRDFGIDEPLPANELSMYIEDDWSISPALRINAGLRFGLFNMNGRTSGSMEPRISARLLLTSNFSLKVSYSNMNQYVQQISDSYISLPTDFWMPIPGKYMYPLSSNQVSAGLYYNLRNNYSFSMEGYYKKMYNLLDYKDGFNFLPSTSNWEDKLTSGRGRSYGLEFIARKETGKFTGWVGYGLMWADRQFAEINDGERFPAKYDNRHKINVVANWKLNEKVELNAGWTYMTGNRITVAMNNYQDLASAGFPHELVPTSPLLDEFGLNLYDTKNNVRLPAYHRLDIGVNIYRPLKKDRMGIWSFGLYNAYSRMNPIVIRKNTVYDFDKYFYLDANNPKISRFQSLAVLPVVPYVSYTYKF